VYASEILTCSPCRCSNRGGTVALVRSAFALKTGCVEDRGTDSFFHWLLAGCAFRRVGSASHPTSSTCAVPQCTSPIHLAKTSHVVGRRRARTRAIACAGSATQAPDPALGSEKPRSWLQASFATTYRTVVPHNTGNYLHFGAAIANSTRTSAAHTLNASTMRGTKR